MDINQDYDLFHNFIKTYSPNGFRDIDANSQLIKNLEQMMEKNNQFFFIGDVLHGKIIFTSKRSIDMIGVPSSELNPYHTIEKCHPDEVYRNTKGWGTIINLASELLTAKKGEALFSVNMKLRNPKGIYSEILFQDYLFYSENPHNTVYVLQVYTNIDFCKKCKTGYHYYSGNEMDLFKFPDSKLLKVGNDYSKRELEIINLVRLGLSTEQIAEELFLSPYTINTHRVNILKKSGHTKISELIINLIEKGIL